MTILSTLLTILIAWIALAVLVSITITRVTAIGGKSYLSAEPVIKQGIDSPSACDCRCHNESMFPGMRCMDCYGMSCDRGTE